MDHSQKLLPITFLSTAHWNYHLCPKVFTIILP